MHMYVYVCIYIYTYTHIYTHIHTYMCACVRVRVCIPTQSVSHGSDADWAQKYFSHILEHFCSNTFILRYDRSLLTCNSS